MGFNITPQVTTDRIEVRFEIFEEEGTVLHTVNTAFPLDAKAEDIKAEGQKAHDLFFQEREQMESQKVVDAKFDQAHATVAELKGEVKEEKPEDEAKPEVSQ